MTNAALKTAIAAVLACALSVSAQAAMDMGHIPVDRDDIVEAPAPEPTIVTGTEHL